MTSQKRPLVISVKKPFKDFLIKDYNAWLHHVVESSATEFGSRRLQEYVRRKRKICSGNGPLEMHFMSQKIDYGTTLALTALI
jgi:hypothetical protein